MQKLWETLEHGFVGTGLVRIPVAGDLNKLIYAHGLTANERKIAQQICFYAQNMPGNQTVRRLMGAAAQGARGVLGDILFCTWSPNEQQSAIVMKLMRNRHLDTMLHGDDAFCEALRLCSGISGPSISSSTVSVELPLSSIRRKLCARDPKAVIAAYEYEVKYKFPWLMGLKTCPHCPDCNLPSSPYPPCQDLFGHNTLPMGGAAGLAVGSGGATEYQKMNTPHFHVNIHLGNMYRLKTLNQIADLIRKKWVDPKSVIRFHEWMHFEKNPSTTVKTEESDMIRSAWLSRSSNTQYDEQCEQLCVMPKMINARSTQTLWNHCASGNNTEETQDVLMENASIDSAREYSSTEGQQFRETYDRTCQIIFSRVQEHHHHPRKGKLVPLRSCLTKKCKTKCKHGFPKAVVGKATVICEGQSDTKTTERINDTLLISFSVFKFE